MITVLSLFACGLAMCGSLFVALGRLKVVYCVGIASGLSFSAVNIALSTRSGQEGVLWLCIPSCWGILMSVIGLRRLHNLKKGEGHEDQHDGAGDRRTRLCPQPENDGVRSSANRERSAVLVELEESEGDSPNEVLSE
ncbi:MAG TPA: hypothetical protein VE988_02785 [Gemmataceae bacterium]|nr:hypothetical protein [Gemmataceae bacterium]